MSSVPVWRVIITKKLNESQWTNRYHVRAENITAAGVIAATILERERVITLSPVTFVSYRVDDAQPDTDVWITTPANVPGQREIAAHHYLPLFNVATFDFSVGPGSPDRKFMRACLTESDVANGMIETAYVTALTANYATPLATHGSICDATGNDWLSGACKPSVGMRQLRRKKFYPPTP